LEQGLAELFGGSAAPARERAPAVATREAAPKPATGDTAVRALIAEAWRRYQAALEANRQVDWARYGEEFRRLGETLERLEGGTSEP
jgi:uncharacterized membrane protein (UPF0182 family)